MVNPVFIYFALVLLVAVLGRKSRYGFLGLLVASIMLTPFVTFMALLLFSDRFNKEKNSIL